MDIMRSPDDADMEETTRPTRRARKRKKHSWATPMSVGTRPEPEPGPTRPEPVPAPSQPVLAASHPEPVRPAAETRSSALPLPSPDPDRWTFVWGAKIWIVLVALVAGLGTYVVNGRLTPTYESSSVVQVVAQPQNGISPDSIALASNDLAAQLAQLVTTSPVIDLAAPFSHDTPGVLGQHIVAAVLANQNLIKITAQGPTPASATNRASAVAGALQLYSTTVPTATATSPIGQALASQLATLDAQLVAARADAQQASAAAFGAIPGSASIAIAVQKEAFVGALQTQRNTLASQITSANVGAQPIVRAIGGISAASKVQPKPALYALVAFVVAALAAGQIAIFAGSRRYSGGRPISRNRA